MVINILIANHSDTVFEQSYKLQTELTRLHSVYLKANTTHIWVLELANIDFPLIHIFSNIDP